LPVAVGPRPYARKQLVAENTYTGYVDFPIPDFRLDVNVSLRGSRLFVSCESALVRHIFHLRDGMVTEFWDASTDEYGFDEVIG
jgi:hypothetical protein